MINFSLFVVMHKGISNVMFYSFFKAQSSLKTSEGFLWDFWCFFLFFCFFFFLPSFPPLSPFLAISSNRALVMLKIQVLFFPWCQGVCLLSDTPGDSKTRSVVGVIWHWKALLSFYFPLFHESKEQRWKVATRNLKGLFLFNTLNLCYVAREDRVLIR